MISNAAITNFPPSSNTNNSTKNKNLIGDQNKNAKLFKTWHGNRKTLYFYIVIRLHVVIPLQNRCTNNVKEILTTAQSVVIPLQDRYTNNGFL